jgi:hypothetical protein
MNQTKSNIKANDVEGTKVHAATLVLALHIVKSGTQNLDEYLDEVKEVHPFVKWVKDMVHLDQCIDWLSRGVVQINQITFDEPSVETDYANQKSDGSLEVTHCGLPFWVTKENIDKIDSAPGSFVWVWQSHDQESRYWYFNEFYKTNIELDESCDMVADYGTYDYIHPYESTETCLLRLLGGDHYPMFKDVKIQSVVSLHAAATSGDFSEVPQDMLNSAFEWSSQSDYGETPIHYAARAGHLDQIPPSVITAVDWLRFGTVSHELGLKHQDLFEFSWNEDYTYDEVNDPNQDHPILVSKKIRNVFACPILLAAAYNQKDWVLELIQRIQPKQWQWANKWAHWTLAEVAEKAGLTDHLNDLLKEIELLPPLAEEDDLPDGYLYLDPIPSED